MKRTSLTGVALALFGSAATVACGDDIPATETESESSTGTPPTTPPVGTTTAPTPTVDSTSVDPPPADSTDGSSTTDPLPPPEPADFVVTIENISNTGLMFSPLSPGVWANHEVNADVLFTADEPDDGEGLEALAEDGIPTDLAAAVATHAGVDQAGVFDTPVGADAAGPILPGDSYEFTFTAEPGTRLSLATMLVGSNDLIIATGANGVSLFAGGGQVMGERDISDVLRVWDAGTEINQAPGQGPLQALHGGSPNMGPPEDAFGVFPYGYSTRAIPLGPDLIAVEVDRNPDNQIEYTVSFTNISGERGTLVTPFSALVWAIHDDTVSLFTPGDPASAELESLAEDGDAAGYDALLGGLDSVDQYAVIPGPIAPGDTVEATFTLNVNFPRFSFATMVVESNDAFLAMGPEGVTIYEDGAQRSDGDINDDIAATLTPWDAGTEANEVPGAGLNQVLRQGDMPNVGAPDPNPEVRRYSDVTNDLAGDNAGGFLQVGVAEELGVYTITILNTSDATAFPGRLNPTVWALHDETVSLFELGMPASPGLELLAEDGDPTGVLGDLMGMAGVGMAGVTDIPVGAPLVSPLSPGQSYEFVVTPDPTARFLSFAGMIVPSNDTFAALDSGGVALLDDAGMPRASEAVAAEIASELRAWDAGTEGNQSGAAGADMEPFGEPNTGPTNGSGVVRRVDDSEVWSQPPAEGLVRVIVAPVAG